LIKYIETLETKYNILKDQVSKLTKVVEEDRNQRDREGNSKSKESRDREFKEFENKIKGLLSEEKEVSYNTNELLFKL